MSLDQNRRISAIIESERTRLGNFISRRVADSRDAEDILQDVFSELVEANRRLMPIEHAAGWLYRVARNRITDLFRKQSPDSLTDLGVIEEGAEMLELEELLPSPDAGPEAQYGRGLLIDELELAIEELPDEQRWVFVEHELEGRSFKELAEESGVNINTLLARKHYAVLYLRQRLQKIYEDYKKG